MVRAVTPIPFVKARFFDRCGKPLTGGKIYTYEANTTTPKVTYKDPYGLTPNTNPIILDAAGEADIYLEGTYRIRITDRNDVLVNDVEKIGSWFSDNLQDTLDNISGAMDEALKPILQNLDEAINTAAAAGAGANGWSDLLVSTMGGRTQREKNADQISVKDFGAKGDGVTSDVAAINAMASNVNRVHFSDGTYLIDSTLTINKPVSFSPNAKIKLANNAKVYFAAGTCDKICAHWFDSANPIQDAVISARDVKRVYARGGIWLIDTPIIIPSEAPYWGVTIEGSSDSQQYENLRSSSSTTIRANKAMNVVIGNRLDWRNESGYYNKVKNLTIDGNNLAKYGYINGYQDTVKGVNVILCQTAGIIFGRLSNSTKLANVSSTRNGNGLILTGLPPEGSSTHALIDNSRFRQNIGAGVLFAQAVGVEFTNCVIESNTAVGIKVKKATTSDDFYAGESAFVSQIYFDRCGMENNGQLLELDGTGLALGFIEFAKCNVVGKTTDKLNPVADIYTKSVRGLIFDYCTMLKIGYQADTETFAVKINAFNTLDNSYPTVFGVSSANVAINKLLDSGDMFSDHIALGLNTQTHKIVTTSRTLSKYDVANTVLTNNGQGDVDLTLTLPMGLVTNPQYSYTFTFVATTQKLAQKLTFNTQSGAYIIYNGAIRTALDTAGNGIGFGTAIKFTLVIHQGAHYWLAENITGSWLGS